VRNTWIILQNIGFAPSVGHQADHEFDGKSRAAYNGFAGEHVRRKRDARMIHDGWLSDPVFRIDITRTWRGTRCRTGLTGAARRMYEGAGLGSKDVDIFNPYSRDHSKFDINAIIDYNNDMQTEAPT